LSRDLERGSDPMASTRAELAVDVTRASLTLATAFALTRVFAGRSWMPALVLAAILPPLLLDWTRRRRANTLVRLAVVVAGSVWLAAVAVDARPTFFGIPSRATMAALGDALDGAPHTLRAAVVPVSATGSALVLAVIGVYAAAALTDWIATGLEAPI